MKRHICICNNSNDEDFLKNLEGASSQTTGKRVESSKDTKIILCFNGSKAAEAGIIVNTIVGPIRVPGGVKLTSKTNSVLRPRIEGRPLSSHRKVIIMQDNAPPHSAEATTRFLASLGIKGNSLVDCPACSPDMNSIENY